MPHKDPVKHKEYQKAYQKVWMVSKLHSRKEAGICRVSGCGTPVGPKSIQYCDHHRELNRINSQNYRNRKKGDQK